MGISDRYSLKQHARDSLQQASCDPKKLVLIHTAAAAAVTLLAAAAAHLIQDGISGTGGLGGIGLRSLLTTVSSVLQNITTLLLPIWSFGYLIFILKTLRREQAGPATLLEGFRHLFPILRLLLIRALLYAGIAFLCLYPSIILFSLTPLAQPLEALMEPMLAMTTEAEITQYLSDALVMEMSNAMIPLVIIYLAMYLVACILITYRIRFADYVLIDHPKAGAIFALRTSSKLLRRNCISLFKLDMSFWWYFLIEAALALICYADVLLPLVGVSLPVSGTAAYFLCYVLYFAGQLIFYPFARNQVECTYAAAYEQRRREAETQ